MKNQNKFSLFTFINTHTQVTNQCITFPLYEALALLMWILLQGLAWRRQRYWPDGVRLDGILMKK